MAGILLRGICQGWRLSPRNCSTRPRREAGFALHGALAVQAGHTQDPADRVIGGDNPQGGVLLSSVPVRGDEHTEAGGLEEANLLEVDPRIMGVSLSVRG
jgi:hypothetical protein